LQCLAATWKPTSDNESWIWKVHIIQKKEHTIKEKHPDKKTDNIRKVTRCTKYKISGNGQIYTLSSG